MNTKKKKVRYAVVGLGYISQVAVLPSFEHARENSELVALISGDGTKLKQLGKKYGVTSLYTYDEYEDCLNSGEIDAVYIALPNTLHSEYTIRAARAGIHVLCEKPMAVTEEECLKMIDETKRAKVKLMIAYRLHFERSNLKALDIVHSGMIGDLKFFNSLFSMQVKSGNSRLKASLGGGTLYDIGIYCINAARNIFKEEPMSVFGVSARGNDRRFREVEETVGAILYFSKDRIASFSSSFGAADISSYDIVGTKGSLRMDHAYEFAEAIEQTLTVEGKKKRETFPKRDQFAPELLYFSDCILNDKSPEPSGWEGLADVRIIRALYRSSRMGNPVPLGRFEKKIKPVMQQEKRRSPVEKQPLVHAETPSL